MPNTGHIWIPLDAQLKAQAEWAELQADRKVWKRGIRKRMSGRVKEIRNLPFINDKGETVRWNPLQVAVFSVLVAGITAGFDVIRVVTPYAPGEPGAVSLAEVDFSIAQLRELVSKDSIFFASVMDGRIQLEEEAVNAMPREWVVTDDGTFAPNR